MAAISSVMLKYVSYGCNVIYDVKKHHHLKVPFGEHFRISYFTDKNSLSS